MSRQEATNTFSEGMVMDLNPLTTPDNVLTDCLNGTFITYNGNEFVLQNDQGNYKLAKAVLNPDFIPVGIKEYANILYIVSYNPITKLCEVGSYPSPQTIFDNSKKTHEPIDINYIKLENVGDNLYTELSKKQLIEVYSTGEDFFLNPGDKYFLTLSLNDSEKEYQTLDFYVLNREKELFDINDIVNIESGVRIPDSTDFLNVNWEVPGWLAYKFRIANINQFNLYLTRFNQPVFINENSEISVNCAIQGQIVTDDILYTATNLHNQLFVRLSWSTNDNTQFTQINEYPVDPINYGSINDFYFTSEILLNLPISEYTQKIKFKAVPVLNTSNDNKVIVYDNFETIIEVDLWAIRNFDEIQAFDTYRYIVGQNDVVLNYMMDTQTSKNNELGAGYKIHQLFPDDTGGTMKLVDAGYLNDFNFIGQNVTTLPFTSRLGPDMLIRSNELQALNDLNPIGNSNPILKSNEFIDGNFTKENIFIFTLIIFKRDFSNSVNLPEEEIISLTQRKEFARTLISSELFNPLYNTETDFSKISLSEWLTQMSRFINTPAYTLSTNNTGLSYIKENWPTTPLDEWVANTTQATRSQFPRSVITADVDINANNLTSPSLFNRTGIWNGMTTDYSLTFRTNQNTNLLYDNTVKPFQGVQKSFMLSLSNQTVRFTKSDRDYLYDRTISTIDDWGDWDNGVTKLRGKGEYFCTARHINRLSHNLGRYDFKKELFTSPRIYNIGDNRLGGFVEDWPSSVISNSISSTTAGVDYFYNKQSDIKCRSLFQLTRFDSLDSPGWSWQMPKQNFKELIQWFALRALTWNGINYSLCVVPFNDGSVRVTGDVSTNIILNHISRLIDQMSLHIYANVNVNSNNSIILWIPNTTILPQETNNIIINRSTYSWSVSDININNKSIFDYNLYNLNYDPLPNENRNNLNQTRPGNLNGVINNNEDILISSDFNGDILDSTGETWTIAEIESDINKLAVNWQTAVSNKELTLAETTGIRENMISHDINELAIIPPTDDISRSYDVLIRNLEYKPDRINHGLFYFLSPSSNFDSLTSHSNSKRAWGTYLAPENTFTWPMIDDTLNKKGPNFDNRI